MELNSKIQMFSPDLKGNRFPKKERVSFGAVSIEQLEKAGLKRETERNIRKFLHDQPLLVRLSYYFSHPKFQGDVANVVITGLGTGIIAPIMIKHNPLSKEDKDTKTYAAWRQPISAVIAVVTQVGITKQVGNIIKKMAASGDFGKEMDTRRSAKFLKRAEKCTDKIEDLSVFAENKPKIITKYLEDKFDELMKKADSLKIKAESGDKNKNLLLERVAVLQKRASDIAGIIGDEEKSKKFFTDRAENFSKIISPLEKRAETITNMVGKSKEMIGIGIALITLPFACGLLNWVYPRFMKIAFPELTNKKESKKTPIVDSDVPVAQEPKANAEGIKS